MLGIHSLGKSLPWDINMFQYLAALTQLAHRHVHVHVVFSFTGHPEHCLGVSYKSGRFVEGIHEFRGLCLVAVCIMGDGARNGLRGDA
jgi:hypothetical protein